MTTYEALDWLAGLKGSCSECEGSGYAAYRDPNNFQPCGECGGSGEGFVLDLREPCTAGFGTREYCHTIGARAATCQQVGCPGWLPKQGWETLCLAMEKAGYHVKVEDDLILFFPCGRKQEGHRCDKPDNCGSYLFHRLMGFEGSKPLEVAGSMRAWEENWKDLAHSDPHIAAAHTIKAMKKLGSTAEIRPL